MPSIAQRLSVLWLAACGLCAAALAEETGVRQAPAGAEQPVAPESGREAQDAPAEGADLQRRISDIFAADEAERTLRRFYDALAAADCATATALRPDYEDCGSARVVKVEIHDAVGDGAFAYVSFSAIMEDEEKDFHGYALMIRSPRGWRFDELVPARETPLRFRDYAQAQFERFRAIERDAARPSATRRPEEREVLDQYGEPDTAPRPAARPAAPPAAVAEEPASPAPRRGNAAVQAPGAARSGSAEAAVAMLYEAVARQDCEAARIVRPAYQWCEEVEEVEAFEIHDAIVRDDAALVSLSLRYRRGGEAKSFDGYVRLDLTPSGWIIDDGVGEAFMSASLRDGAFREFAETYFTRALAARTEAPSPGDYSPEPAWPGPAAGMAGPIWADFMPRHFGSAKIMQSCFRAADLRGRPGEKKPPRDGPGAVRNPPDRQRPHRADATLAPAFRGSIRRVDTGGRKVIALGFDIDEQNHDFAGYDAEIIEYLRRMRVKATMYVGGKWLYTHPDRARQLIADPLFEIGNHAWTHGNFRLLPPRLVEEQIYYTEIAYEDFRNDLAAMDCVRRLPDSAAEMARIPVRMPTFRFPYGTCNARSLKQVNDAGLPAVQWDVVTADPAPRQTAEAIARALLSAKPGSIAVLHANGRGWQTGKALPLAIPKMLEQDWEFVTVTELLAMGKPQIVQECYERVPGDNHHYDRIFGLGTGD